MLTHKSKLVHAAPYPETGLLKQVRTYGLYYRRVAVRSSSKVGGARPGVGF